MEPLGGQLYIRGPWHGAWLYICGPWHGAWQGAHSGAASYDDDNAAAAADSDDDSNDSDDDDNSDDNDADDADDDSDSHKPWLRILLCRCGLWARCFAHALCLPLLMIDGGCCYYLTFSALPRQ